MDAISSCSTESPSVDSNITNEANVHKSLNGSISGTVSCKDMLSDVMSIMSKYVFKKNLYYVLVNGLFVLGLLNVFRFASKFVNYIAL